MYVLEVLKSFFQSFALWMSAWMGKINKKGNKKGMRKRSHGYGFGLSLLFSKNGTKSQVSTIIH